MWLCANYQVLTCLQVVVLYMIYFPYQSLDFARIIAMIQLYHTAYSDVFLKAMAYVAMCQLPSTNMPTGCSS